MVVTLCNESWNHVNIVSYICSHSSIMLILSLIFVLTQAWNYCILWFIYAIWMDSIPAILYLSMKCDCCIAYRTNFITVKICFLFHPNISFIHCRLICALLMWWPQNILYTIITKSWNIMLTYQLSTKYKT